MRHQSIFQNPFGAFQTFPPITVNQMSIVLIYLYIFVTTKASANNTIMIWGYISLAILAPRAALAMLLYITHVKTLVTIMTKPEFTGAHMHREVFGKCSSPTTNTYPFPTEILISMLGFIGLRGVERPAVRAVSPIAAFTMRGHFISFKAFAALGAFFFGADLLMLWKFGFRDYSPTFPTNNFCTSTCTLVGIPVRFKRMIPTTFAAEVWANIEMCLPIFFAKIYCLLAVVTVEVVT